VGAGAVVDWNNGGEGEDIEGSGKKGKREGEIGVILGWKCYQATMRGGKSGTAMRRTLARVLKNQG